MPIHCLGGCAREVRELGQDDHHEQDNKDECILSIHCPGGCVKVEEPIGGCSMSLKTQDSGWPVENTLLDTLSGQVGETGSIMSLKVIT